MSALAERLRRLSTQAGAQAQATTQPKTTPSPAKSSPSELAPAESVPTKSAQAARALPCGERAQASAGLKALLRRHLGARREVLGSGSKAGSCVGGSDATDEHASGLRPEALTRVSVAGSQADTTQRTAEAKHSPKPTRWVTACPQASADEVGGSVLKANKCAIGSATGHAAPLHSAHAEASGASRADAGLEIGAGLFEHLEFVPHSPPPPWLRLPDVSQQRLPTDSLLHFDTETTGLAGGAGTRAFMLGFARWNARGLELRQLWITRLAAEVPMLERFAQWLAECPAQLVSYNGRSFDAPLLAARYRLCRMRDPLRGLPHHDLLHAVRRRFRGDWPSCRLADAEQRLLGVERIDDLPGAEAPAAFLSALRGHGMAPLRRVQSHHRQDLISLAMLLPRLCQLASEAPAGWALRQAPGALTRT